MVNLSDDRQCTATAKSTGERCQRAAIKGGNVCPVHGGAAPQTKQKAQERLDKMADSVTADMADHVDDLLEQYNRVDDPEDKVELMRELRQVWKLVLDRTGHGPTEKRELTGEDGGPVEIAELTEAEKEQLNQTFDREPQSDE